MRKRLIFILTLTCMMILTMSFGSVSTAFAADDDTSDGYGYVIKIYPGLKGTYMGSSEVTTLHKQMGESVTISIDDVQVTDDEYYARGFRIAGHDNDEMEGETITGFTRMTFDVTEDVNYEVAYGIKGAMVPYTIRYLDDASGRVISDEDTYYGMPGDKPVISFKYIKGYQPNVYNITKKLTENAAENVFEFRYTAGGNTQTSTTTVTRVVPAAPGTTANPAGTNVGAANAANAANAGAANDGAATIGDNATPLADGPQQFTDLDDAETPTASGSFQFAKLLPYIGGGLAVVLIVLALLWFILRKKKDEGEAEAVAAAEVEEEVFKHVYK